MISGISIRRYEPDDAPALFEAARESVDEVFPWLEWCHPDYEATESQAWIEHCRVAWEAGDEYQFAIIGSDETFLGGCGLNRLEHQHRVANLGYWVRTPAAGRGVATVAVRRLAGFAFDETDLNRLQIVVAVGNHASQRVAERAGAVREAVTSSRLVLHGKTHDAIQYAIVRGAS
jgi:RimJ/RimL family protein N-acetyltransferase